MDIITSLQDFDREVISVSDIDDLYSRFHDILDKVVSKHITAGCALDFLYNSACRLSGCLGFRVSFSYH